MMATASGAVLEDGMRWMELVMTVAVEMVMAMVLLAAHE
jgi:hypothetical protein